MLPLLPLPTRSLASGTAWNGRGRPTASLIVLITNASPRARTRTRVITRRRARAPPFQSKPTPSTISAGINQALLLHWGRSKSSTGLLSFRLMKRNRARSMGWNHDTKDSVGTMERLPRKLKMVYARRMDWMTQWFFHQGKFLGIEWHAWKVVGWAGNILFTSRFFVQ